MGLGHPPLDLPCQVRGDNIFWIINGEFYGSRNIAKFRNLGITVTNSVYNGDIITANVRVVINRPANNTVIICEAQAAGFNKISSGNATIFITSEYSNYIYS